MSNAIRWLTAFSHHEYPVIDSLDLSEGLKVRLRSGDSHYEVKCESIVALSLVDEQVPSANQGAVGCAAIIHKSNWIQSLAPMDIITVIYGDTPKHYVIYGANWKLEFLCIEEPLVICVSE